MGASYWQVRIAQDGAPSVRFLGWGVWGVYDTTVASGCRVQGVQGERTTLTVSEWFGVWDIYA